jgi:hypothetical protein
MRIARRGMFSPGRNRFDCEYQCCDENFCLHSKDGEQLRSEKAMLPGEGARRRISINTETTSPSGANRNARASELGVIAECRDRKNAQNDVERN